VRPLEASSPPVSRSTARQPWRYLPRPPLQCGLLPPQFLLQSGQRPIANLGHLRQVPLALGLFRGKARRLDLLLESADPLDAGLLAIPPAAEFATALLQLCHFGFQPVEALQRIGVRLPLHGLALDGELSDLALNLVQDDGEAVNLHPEHTCGLIHKVDGLIGQEPVRDVPVRQRRRSNQGRVADAHAVMHLVSFAQSPQDRDGVLHAGLAHQDGLESPLQRGVLLDTLPVLVQGRGADTAKLTAGQCRLEHVAGVDGSLGRARADQGVEFIDEENDPACRLCHLPEQGFQPILELAPILGPRHERPQVEGHHLLLFQRFGDVSTDDPLCQSFHDGGLPDTRFADQNRVVLRPAGEHLDDATNLLIATDHRVQFPLLCQVGEVPAVPLERLVLFFRVGIGDPLAAADRLKRGIDGILGHSACSENLHRGAGCVAQDAEQQMLSADVLILQASCLFLCPLEDLIQPRRHVDLGRTVDFWELPQFLPE